MLSKPIRLKRLVTPGAVPTPDQLVLGELCLNVADGKVFIELTDGEIICIGSDVAQFVSVTELESKANQADVTAALNAKASTVHSHPIGDVSELQSALDGKTAIGHTHQISDVTTLSDVLNGKANQADVAAALNAKSNTNSLGSAAFASSSTFATSAQGTKADTALQSVNWAVPGAIGATTPNTGRFTNVGIGTNLSAAGLHVVAPFAANVAQLAIQASGATDQVGLSLFNVAGSRTAILYTGVAQDFFLQTAQDTGFSFRNAGGERLRVTQSGDLVIGGVARLKIYTVATVPSAAANIGGVIYVSNEALGATPAFSDGANWRRIHDRAIIS
jgi:hypothetical protein